MIRCSACERVYEDESCPRRCPCVRLYAEAEGLVWMLGVTFFVLIVVAFLRGLP